MIASEFMSLWFGRGASALAIGLAFAIKYPPCAQLNRMTSAPARERPQELASPHTMPIALRKHSIY